MPEAYRGLTVRIGADTSNLRQAMQQLKHSSYSLQRDFRVLSKALRIDPSNYRLLQATTKSLRGAMGSAAAEAGRLGMAIDQIGKQKGFGRTTQTIQQLSHHTKNAKLEAAHAADEYNILNKRIEQVYMAVARYRSSHNIHGTGSYKDELAAVKKLAHNWSDATAQKKLYRQVRTAVMNGENPWGLTGSGEELLRKYDSVFKRLRASWAQTEERLNRANQVVGFQNIKNDALIAEAEIKRLSAEFTKLHAAELRLGTGKVKALAGDIKNAGYAADEAQDRINKLDEALRLDPHNVDAARQKMAAFKERVEATEREIVKMGQRMREMDEQGFRKAVVQAEKLGKSVKQIENEFTDANAKVESLRGKLDEARRSARMMKEVGEGNSKAYQETRNEIKRLSKSLENAEREARKLNTQFEIAQKAHAYREQAADLALAKSRLVAYNAELRQSMTLMRMNAGKSLKNIGYAGLSTITPALMMGGMLMVQAADEVDAAYRNMRKTVNGTEEDFEKLRDAALKFASTHMTSADQMLEIEAIGGQLGIVVENLGAFGETVANLDIATNMDTETIAADLGKMGSVLGMSVDEYDNFGDALVRLGNNMPAFESDIMTITTRFMGMGKVVGMSAPEMLAWATAATATGQKAEAAGSSMQRFISNMETAVNGDIEELEKWATVAGMSADEFARKFKTDASGAMYDFVRGLGEIQRSGGSVNQTLMELGINNVRDKQLLEGLAQQMANSAGSTTLLNDALTMSLDAWNGLSDEWGQAGDAANEAAKKAEGFSGQLQILKNNGQILGVELAEGLAPILVKLNDVVQGITNVFSSMSDGMKTFIVGAAGLSAVFGPMAVVSGVLMNSWGNMNQQLTTMGGAWNKVVKEERAFGTHMKKTVTYVDQLGNSYTQVTKPIKTAGGGIEYVTETSKRAAPALKKLGNMAKLTAMSFGPMLAVGAIVTGLGMLIGKISEYKEHQRDLEHATKGLKDAVSSFGGGLDSIAGSIAAVNGGAHVAAMSVDELTESLGEHADNINSIAKEADFTVGELEHWQEIINHAATDNDWGLANLSLVEMAVQEVNDATGSQLSAQQLVSGEYANQLGYINRIIDAQKESIQVEAARNIVIEAEQAAYEAQLTLEQARADLAAAEAEYERDPDWKHKREMEDAQRAYNEAQQEAVAAADAQAAAYENLDNVSAHLASSQEELAAFLQGENFDIFEDDDAQHLADIGTSYDEVAEAMERLGVSSQTLAEIGPEGARALIEAYVDGGEPAMLSALNNMTHGLSDVTETAEDMQSVLLSIDGERIFYEVDDNGTIYDNGVALEGLRAFQIGNIWYAVSDDGTIYDANHKLDELEARELRPLIEEIEADTSSADRAIRAMEMRRIVMTAQIGVNTTYLKSSVDTFFNQHTFKAKVSANISAKIGGLATGGFIPAHAAGGFNGIVTKPTFTNVGLVGEAGAEAIMRWAGGTSIVPLQNRQYVRPFARTIAEEMPMAFGGYNLTAADIAAALAQVNLQVRMDSGELVGVLVSNSQRKAAMNVG